MRTNVATTFSIWAHAGLVCLVCSPAVAATPDQRYDLPAQPLSTSLQSVALASGVSIIAPAEIVAGKSAPALSGRHSLQGAVSLLLRGSGLRWVRTGATILIERDASATQATDKPRRQSSRASATCLALHAQCRQRHRCQPDHRPQLGPPGFVTAQVTQNAYDSATGRILLTPQGTRLIGSYDSVVAYGQSRALAVWQRLVLPNGSSIRIENLPATDAGGSAGLMDEVDRHTWSLLKGIALSTLLGVGTELSFGSSESDLVRAVRESTQQNTARAGDQIVTKNLNIQPTIRVRAGAPLRVVVHKDLVLAPWRNSRGG